MHLDLTDGTQIIWQGELDQDTLDYLEDEKTTCSRESAVAFVARMGSGEPLDFDGDTIPVVKLLVALGY